MDQQARRSLLSWVNSGAPWIWLTAGTISFSLILVFGLLGLITLRGMGHFWPHPLVQFDLTDSAGTTQILGELVEEETVAAARIRALGIAVAPDVELVDRALYKVGNRDLTGSDFRWVLAAQIQILQTPPDAFVAEREEWGNFYGYAVGITAGDQQLDLNTALWTEIENRLERRNALVEEVAAIEKRGMNDINHALERLRLEERAAHLEEVPETAPLYTEIAAQRAALGEQYTALTGRLEELRSALARDRLIARTADGTEHQIALENIRRIYRPNAMSLTAKIALYFYKLAEFVLDEPREANTEGGVFPAIFGTVLMVLLMSVFVTPFGVIAAVYLREYANQGPLTRLIRIAVNNLAGVPSVVYGVFGLGFFVYFVGGSIDRAFYAESLPAPTFGTPGLMWSSLTLALLTVPVVIVATEEGLARIPRSIREGSLALGATKAETLWRTVLPMATPAMMTGLILAVARAAGEVAPLMMVGVVKLAPTLPMDSYFPFLHLDRKFMHLGFHIYDVGFQSPNVEAARPLVYATSLLLVLIIVSLNLAAIALRNRLREKYNAADT